MAFSTVISAAIFGLQVELIHVEADVSSGLPAFHMVGYLSSEVKEASERVRTAIRNSGVTLPPKKMVVNLAPATVRKRGASFDLPIALALLVSMGMIPNQNLKDTLIIGELSLDGRLREVKGILPMVLHAKEQGIHTCILPKENEAEGLLAEGMCIWGAENLSEVCACLRGEGPRGAERKRTSKEEQPNLTALDFCDIQGQETVKRAAEVAVAGGHNLLLLGPPGSGKSMLAKRIPTILPPPLSEESLEITKIYSVAGLVDRRHPLMTGRPFRSVHHTTTRASLIGGGNLPTPGEISLAHGGVLFLDELAEFPKSVLEVLRQPLEEHQIRIIRNHGIYEFPANFMLVAAMNPCPCGNYPDFEKCTCTPGQIQNYLGKISQPFLDRMDLCVEVPGIAYETLRQSGKPETSAQIRERVEKARRVQEKRFCGTSIRTNSMLPVQEIPRHCQLGDREETLMKQAFQTLGLTARTYHKILKVARTIADLEGEILVGERHLKEAIGYRTMDKKYWGR